jgi:nucleoid DNA-binding protein
MQKVYSNENLTKVMLMNSQDIARLIYEQSDKKIALQDINKILDKHNSIIKDSLSKNEPVEISGLGTFTLSSNIVKPLIQLRKRVNPKKK